jgi:MarR family transcriptional regulator, organic hydroperoxide resistance regulator
VINESIVLAVQQAAHASAQALAAAVHADKLAPSEVNALANLVDGQPRTVSQLAVAAGVRPTTLTSLLDRLEGRDLLIRRPSPHDRRSVLVELTPAGLVAARRAHEAIVELERRALGDLSDDARHALLSALRTLAEIAS